MQQKVRYSLLFMSLLAAACCALFVYLTRGMAKESIGLVPWFDDSYHNFRGKINIVGPMTAVLLAIFTLVLYCVSEGRIWGGRVVSSFAVLSSGVLSVLCALASVRSARCLSIEEYLGQLESATHEIPRPGVKHTYERLGFSGRHLPDQPMITEYRAGPHGRRENVIGDLRVLQSCAKEGCRLALAPSAEDPPPWDSITEASPLQRWNEALRFTRDPSGEVLFLDKPEPHFEPYLVGSGGDAAGRSKPEPHREFHLVGGRWEAVELSPLRVAAKTSAPSAWLWTGLAGLAVVGALVAARRRVASRRQVLKAARAGTLSKDGRVTFEDGSVIRVDPPPAIAPGPVLVLRDLSSSTYRHNDALAGKDIRAGTLEKHLTKLRFDVLRCEAAAAAVASLAAAPLVGAATVGLVF